MVKGEWETWYGATKLVLKKCKIHIVLEQVIQPNAWDRWWSQAVDEIPGVDEIGRCAKRSTADFPATRAFGLVFQRRISCAPRRMLDSQTPQVLRYVKKHNLSRGFMWWFCELFCVASSWSLLNLHDRCRATLFSCCAVQATCTLPYLHAPAPAHAAGVQLSLNFPAWFHQTKGFLWNVSSRTYQDQVA